MRSHCRADSILFIVALALGLVSSTGYGLGLVAASGLPFTCLLVPSRWKAFHTATIFYAAGLWPMLTGLERYLGPMATPGGPAAIWISCSLFLAIPWTLCWTSNRVTYLWRVPLAILATIIPPIGLIGFLSPVVCSGLVFPGFQWVGFLLVLLFPGVLLAFPGRRLLLLPSLTLLSIGANLAAKEKPAPKDWTAVNTSFGDVSQPFRDYEVAQWIQHRANQSSATVLIFPEFVVPRWSEVTEAFWNRTLARCSARKQTLVIGAGIPRPLRARVPELEIDLQSNIAALIHDETKLTPQARTRWSEPYDNTLLVLGTERTAYRQRVPVPLGMWRPWSLASVPLRLQGSGVVPIDGQRAAVLICYEQLIAWPVLVSMLERPTILIGISNTFWFNDTAIPRYQQSAIRAWARLFGLPVLTAVNS